MNYLKLTVPELERIMNQMNTDYGIERKNFVSLKVDKVHKIAFWAFLKKNSESFLNFFWLFLIIILKWWREWV